ncbi:MAG: FAD-binding oxidoreductase, partial [Acidimicrobiales bacterium]
MVVAGSQARSAGSAGGAGDDEPWGALAAELASGLEGEVRFDPGSRALYAYDGSIYRQVPIGVVIPKSTDDVVRAVEICRRHGAPVLSRGCGTSVAGQCVNVAVVIDHSKYLNEILEIDAERRRARVQPGVICDRLRDAAGEHGLTYGPDPSTHDHCTLGGMVGNNSCGTHALMAGKTVDNIEQLEILLYDGTRMVVGPTSDEELAAIIDAGGRKADIYAGLKRIADRYGQQIRDQFPDIPRRVSGYNLDDLLPEKGFNVARALVGSEGTCVTVLQATARLVPSPPKRSLVVLGFPDMPSAGHAVPALLELEPIGLEFFDSRVVGRLDTKGVDLGGERLLPEGECWLLVEFGADTQEESEERANRLREKVQGWEHAPTFKLYEDASQETAVWEVRRHSVGASRMPAGLGGNPGWANWEDAAVSPDRLGDYLADQLDLLGEYGYDGMFYGHFGQGCVHCRIDFDLRSAGGIQRFRSFMERSADLVVSYGGSLSGEHGDGHGRAELWPKMFGPELMTAFAEFKSLWDPDNRMNPGKLVDPYRLDEHLREGAGYQPVRVSTHFGFPEDAGDFSEAAGRC